MNNKNTSALPCNSQYVFQFLGVQHGRFFTDDMFSRLQCLYGKRPVKMVRRCDQNHVNIRRREEFLV